MKIVIALSAGLALAALAGTAGAQTLPSLGGLLSSVSGSQPVAVVATGGGLVGLPGTNQQVGAGSGAPIIGVAALSPGAETQAHNGSAVSVSALNTFRTVGVALGPKNEPGVRQINIGNGSGQPLLGLIPR